MEDHGNKSEDKDFTQHPVDPNLVENFIVLLLYATLTEIQRLLCQTGDSIKEAFKVVN